MTLFNSMFQKILDWKKKQNTPLKFIGMDQGQWTFIFQQFLKIDSPLSKENHFFILSTTEEAEEFYEIIKKSVPGFYIEYLPGPEFSPYSNIIPSETDLYRKFRLLHHLSSDTAQKNIIVCPLSSYLSYLPQKNFFSGQTLEIKPSDIIPPLELAEKCVSMGYSNSPTVEEPGSFSLRGEIMDIYPMSGPPLRIHYFDEMIEEIFEIDLESQLTRKEKPVEKIILGPSPQVLGFRPYRTTLRENLPNPEPKFKLKFEKRKGVMDLLQRDQLFEEYPNFLPLFFSEVSNIWEYLDRGQTNLYLINRPKIIESGLEFLEKCREDFEFEKDDPASDQILPSPEKLFNNDLLKELEGESKIIELNPIQITQDLTEDHFDQVHVKIKSARVFLGHGLGPINDRPTYIKKSLKYINEYFAHSGSIIFSGQNEESKKEIRYLFETLDPEGKLKSRVQYFKEKIGQGFFYPAEKILVLSEGDLFSYKTHKTKKATPKKTDLFAEQISSLKEGDYVIHNVHGIGKYLGLESMELNQGTNDYLVVQYEENDKIYVPVYKMNLIQKHADSNASVKLANLRSTKFSQAKARAKKSAQTLAFDLLKLQAERQSSPAFAFSPPDHIYKEFELAFPFKETKDQANAVENILEEMQKPIPMDHLVCGDVGFGKTEVAMRAAFKAVLDNKQVAVLVPTTILAYQHFNSFKNRFKHFPVKIEFISRFKKPKELGLILEDVKEGKVDVLIGTHKLLSDKIKFKDLGLMIIDEEQRFGVGHKEKLKLLKSSVDCLTLTATPIPRTLQLAFLGLKDLSLIQTAPPKRQSIKSYLIKEDDQTIRLAIQKELNRGGQVYVVHNRVQDMDIFASKIRELVPTANIDYAHGQLKEKELEQKMKDFYEGKTQVLIATTIIESGIDIPNANTMIIDHADKYGLAQLHQLRGRIGRSERKAYAYFVIDKNRRINPQAERRLKALQTYAEMGSGFSLASCDLEIRGAGDILGASQSGHIESIGLELYMELLKEAIQEIRGEKKLVKRDLEIVTPFPSFIPNHYISDSGQRLKYYKKISNCNSEKELEQCQIEIEDLFGHPPSETQNLFHLIEARLVLQKVGVKLAQLTGPMITLSFDKTLLESNQEMSHKLVSTFIGQPKTYTFTPDYKMIYQGKKEIDLVGLIEFSKGLVEKIIPS